MAAGVSPQSALNFNPPLPTITSLSPASVLASSASFTLTINGANFLPGAGATVALWNRQVLATTYVSSTQITAVVLANMIPFGSAGITVVTSAGMSSSVTFTIYPAQPIITGMSQSSIPAGSGAFTLTVYGTYFTSTATVNWGATPLV